jgi:hypothetical protein
MGGIYWLVSYPKSGNTWMRVLMENYWRDRDSPADINRLALTSMITTRALFDELLCIDSGNLTLDEVDALRPAIYRYFSTLHGGQKLFCKIHNAYQRLSNGDPIFPHDATAGVIYIVRSPLDVAISYAYHNRSSIDQAIEQMGDAEHTLALTTETQWGQTHQWLSSWSGNVATWLESGVRLHLVRYEDLTRDPAGTFSDAIRFITGDADPARIEKAIRFSSFGELQKQERERGFGERMAGTAAFFREGRAGGWRETLTTAQVARIVADHGVMMERLGYLDANGAPI